MSGDESQACGSGAKGPDKKLGWLGCPRSRRLILATVIALILLSIYPAWYMVRGYSRAHYADRHGITMHMRVRIDGFGCSLAGKEGVPNEAFSREVFDAMSGPLYFRREDGVDEGLSGLLYAIGVNLFQISKVLDTGRSACATYPCALGGILS